MTSSHVQMWELDHKESWALKNWCFSTLVLEKTLESLLDSKEIKPVNSKGNQPGIFIGRTDGEAEAPILWPPDVKSWLMGKDPDTGKDWGQEKGVTEDKMVGWHHRLNGQTPFLIKLWEIMKDRIAWRAAVHGVAESGMTQWLNDNKQWSWWGHHSPQGESNASSKGSLRGLQQCGLILNLWGTKSPECFSTPPNLSCLPNTLPLSPLGTIIQFSCSVVSDSLRPHETQHARPPCLSPTPGLHPNPCPSSRWCHPAISSSVILFSSCPQSSPASGSFQMSQFLHQVAKVLEFQLQHQSFQWTLRTDLL